VVRLVEVVFSAQWVCGNGSVPDGNHYYHQQQLSYVCSRLPMMSVNVLSKSPMKRLVRIGSIVNKCGPTTLGVFTALCT
jgi:hypothetical protein